MKSTGLIQEPTGRTAVQEQRSGLVLLSLLFILLLFGFPPLEPIADTGNEVVGSGDGSIHIIPSLSAVSVKNGGRLTISAVVKAARGVERVEAEIEGVETIPLEPAAEQPGSVNAEGTLGLYAAEWVARGLEERTYRVSVRVTDRSGHVFEDQSLGFSDPVAGITKPGGTAYPKGGMRRLGAGFLLGGNNISCAVIDTSAGYAYFGTNTSPGCIVKVALGSTAEPPVRVGTLTLKAGDDRLLSAVIDPSAGYAYFGTDTSPGCVVKVALGAGGNPLRRVGAATLDPGEDGLQSAVIDPSASYAYFGTRTLPGRVVKVALGAGSDPPARLGAVTLDAGEDMLSSAVIDATGGYAYFGTDTFPGRVVKVALGSDGNPPTRMGAVLLGEGEDYLRGAVIDPAGGYAYFGTWTYPGYVVKIALGQGGNPPTRVGAIALEQGEDHVRCAVIDPAAGYAYFGLELYYGRVVKVALGSGGDLPRRVGAIMLQSGEDDLQSGVIDPAEGYAYFTYRGPYSGVVKVALGSGDNPPTRVTTADLSSKETNLNSAVIDPFAGYAYLSFNDYPADRVVKVALGMGGQLPRRVGAVTLAAGEYSVSSAVIDPVAGYAYFGTNSSPGYVVKVALGPGDTPPSRVGAAILEPGENALTGAAIDPAAGYAYFGTYSYGAPARVVKVALGSGNNPPSRVGAAMLEPGEERLSCAVIDPLAGYAYFGTNESPGRVVKVALGLGSNLPSRVGAVTLSPDEGSLYNAVIDPAAGYAYFGTFSYDYSSRVVKVALGPGSAAPSRVGAATLEPAGRIEHINSMAIDPSLGLAFCGTSIPGYPGRIVKVALGPGSAAPSIVAAATLDIEENDPAKALIDPAAGYVYFGTRNDPGRVVKIGYTQRDSIKATRLALAEAASVRDVRFFSHVADGNVRLGIYRDNDKALLWESPSTPNTAAADWLIVPISAGSPGSLTLAAGTYWLAWQVDSFRNVPSYAEGPIGDGFLTMQPYGPFKPALTDPSLKHTPETWSMYITYDLPSPTPTATSTPTITPTYTITPTPTRTPVPTRTPTGTATQTPTPRPSPTTANLPPTLQSAKIAPDPGVEGEPLQANGIGYFDPDGDPPGFRYRWFVNGIEILGQLGQQLEPQYFAAGDVVSALVFPFDGRLTGSPQADSVRIVVDRFRLTVRPEELAVRAGRRAEYLVSVIPETTHHSVVQLSVITANPSGLVFEFTPDVLEVRPGQQEVFSILTVHVGPAAESGTRYLIVRGSSAAYSSEQTAKIILLPAVPTQSTLSLNTDRDSVQAGQKIALSGALQPPADGAQIAVELSGDFSKVLNTLTDPEGKYRLLFQPLHAGTLNVQAHAPAQNAVSRQLGVSVGRREPRMAMATDATGDEGAQDQMRIYGQLGTLNLGGNPPPVSLRIVQRPLAKPGEGLSAASKIRQASESVPLSPEGDFAATIGVEIDDGQMEVQAYWPGDGENEAVESVPLLLRLGEARLDQRALVVGGQPMSTSRPVVGTLVELATGTLSGRGMGTGKVQSLLSLGSDIASVSAGLSAMQTADEILLYFVGEGSEEGLRLGDGSLLTPTALGELLAGIPATVVVLIDADHAGLFTGPLVGTVPPGSGRVIITSTGATGHALFSGGGALSFSGIFFQAMRTSATVEECFSFTNNYLKLASGLFSVQTPQIVTVNASPGTIIFGTAFGTEESDQLPPIVLSLDVPAAVGIGRSATLEAQILDNSIIAAATATILSGSTGYLFETAFEPIPNTTERYGTAPILFDEPGAYSITVLVLDDAGNLSPLETVQVPVVGEAIKGDLNGDGCIDYLDLLDYSLLWLRQRAGGPYNYLGDFNNDLVIDEHDMLDLYRNWHRVNP